MYLNDTFGLGLSISGATKLIRFVNQQFKRDPILTFLSHHLDIQYNFSIFHDDQTEVLDGIKYNGIKISFY